MARDRSFQYADEAQNLRAAIGPVVLLTAYFSPESPQALAIYEAAFGVPMPELPRNNWASPSFGSALTPSPGLGKVQLATVLTVVLTTALVPTLVARSGTCAFMLKVPKLGSVDDVIDASLPSRVPAGTPCRCRFG